MVAYRSKNFYDEPDELTDDEMSLDEMIEAEGLDPNEWVLMSSSDNRLLAEMMASKFGAVRRMGVLLNRLMYG